MTAPNHGGEAKRVESMNKGTEKETDGAEGRLVGCFPG